ncbi:MAG: MarR family transcriptional regulator [Candidatus Saccharimonadales bacterium]
MNDLSQTVCEELLALTMDLKHDLMELADDHNLTLAQLFALMTINRHGSMPMRKMADLLHCDASNVTGIVERLVGSQLIIRSESEHDRREKVLTLTPNGSTVVNKFLSQLPHRLGDGKLTTNELTSLASVFKKLHTPHEKVSA